MINIPEKVKIAGFTYDVIRPETSFVNAATAAACDGLHSYDSQEITVAKRGSAEYQSLVFLHEVCHAICSAYCGGILSDYDEEKFVAQFAKGLFQAIEDNPEILRKEERL